MSEEPLARLLGEPLVRALDAYFNSRERLIAALIAGDEAAAKAANRESRAGLSMWLALIVERLDSRTASMLVDVLTRLENLEALMRIEPARADDTDDTDDPTGFDAGRKL
jgi:hypothetical protein